MKTTYELSVTEIHDAIVKSMKARGLVPPSAKALVTLEVNPILDRMDREIGKQFTAKVTVDDRQTEGEK